MRMSKFVIAGALALSLLGSPVTANAAGIVDGEPAIKVTQSVQKTNSVTAFKNRKPKVTKVTKSDAKDARTVYWSTVKGAKGYIIKFSVDSKFRKEYEPTTVVLKGKDSNVIDCISLKKNKKYYFKVRAYTKNSSGKKIYSKWSDTKTIIRK